MTPAHRHRAPHRYAPPRVTALAALAAAGVVAVGVSLGLLLADSADAAPALPPAAVCEVAAHGGMSCADREPLRPVAETGGLDAVLVAR